MTGALIFLGAWLVLILLWGWDEPPKASVYMRLRPGSDLGERPVAPAGRAPKDRRQP